MNAPLSSRLSAAPSSSHEKEAHYQQLTSRNHHFIASESQRKLRNLKVLIAGCGSTGGACIEALARAGIENFVLADNGEYELTNLNRQHARLGDIGKNKALHHRDEVLAINPFANVTIDDRGIHPENVQRFCEWADIIFDAVDVTTPAGIEAKLSLHIKAKALRKPVLSALDVGLRQWGKSFDYRNEALKVLDGKLEAARKSRHPIRALFEIYPISLVPGHALGLVIDLLEGRSSFASQLGCTSDALSAIIVPVMLRFVESGELTPGWNLDLDQFRQPATRRLTDELKYLPSRLKLRRLLKQIQ